MDKKLQSDTKEDGSSILIDDSAEIPFTYSSNDFDDKPGVSLRSSMHTDEINDITFNNELGVSLQVQRSNIVPEPLGVSLGETTSTISDSDVLNTSQTQIRAPQLSYQFQSDSELEYEIEEICRSSTPVKKHTRVQDKMVLLPSPLKIPSEDQALLNSQNRTIEGQVENSLENKVLKTGSKVLLQKAMFRIKETMNLARNCSDSCLVEFSASDIRKSRYKFWIKDYQNRTEWMIDKLEDATEVHGQYFFSTYRGKNICSKCFCLLYKINKNFFYLCLKKFKEGILSSKLKSNRSKSKLYDDAHAWLQNYSEFYGDQMPHKSETYLPYRFKKTAVYQKYVDEKTEDLNSCIAESTFMRMWQKEFEWLKIRKTNTFSKCDKCTGLDRQMEMTRDPRERAEIKKLIACHNEHQKGERSCYRHKRELARMLPDQYISLIIDGMDQAKTNLPHFTGRKSKCLDASYILKTHIQGIISHGDDMFYTFLDLNEYSHDPNMVINTLLKVLYSRFLRYGKLSDVLFIQADNCFRENKNKYVLAFCEILVRMRIFSEVQLSFLYVGHTHEDIDAKFGCIADELRKKDAITIPQLKAILPNVHDLKGLYDFKKWVEPFLNNIQNHSKPLHFMFKRTSDADVEGFYKGQHDHPWIAFAETILYDMPAGKPSNLEPHIHHEMLKNA